eukprot:CAMPEP_0181170530 /NCGR_PEP_ID=MMETSP1096-20121128/1413_1 /TAXON_ID=156174 ORGANISM="Chrysochromulina ericina, Strain CCMP281" /NCGR_SAMPLE_ID=MMETSP1096 /ASSEMBLY_ACC=CAM_ASM_000453 /LENGTH=70 /DNA_ID=CAMNT_0023258093 /DNA_START=311 /DNA_END=520 /DNA_ORIENTATION=-
MAAGGGSNSELSDACFGSALTKRERSSPEEAESAAATSALELHLASSSSLRFGQMSSVEAMAIAPSMSCG